MKNARKGAVGSFGQAETAAFTVQLEEKLKASRRTLPTNSDGDYAFAELLPQVEAGDPTGLLDIFTVDEVLWLVNRSLYLLKTNRCADCSGLIPLGQRLCNCNTSGDLG